VGERSFFFCEREDILKINISIVHHPFYKLAPKEKKNYK